MTTVYLRQSLTQLTIKVFMEYNSPNFKNSGLSKILLVLSIIIFVFWFFGQNTDIYRFAFVGAIFEFLWVFMLMALFILPILSIIFLIKERFNLRSFYLYILIITATNIMLMIFLNK
jgi:FlaA1/EpsC-like NDP-sugar epimerase